MRKWFTEIRRQRAVTAVVENGQRLRYLYQLREAINPSWFPMDWEAVGAMIERRERKREKLLDYLRRTA